MTSTDRLAEMAAEISRLRTKIVGLEAIVADNEARVANSHGMAAEIERLREHNEQLKGLLLQSRRTWQTELEYYRVRKAEMSGPQLAEHIKGLYERILEREAAIAIALGTLERPTPDDPARYTHNIPPSAPPHDER